MTPRFTVSPAGEESFRYWVIVDAVSDRIIAQSFCHADAEFVRVKLNSEAGTVKPQVRQLLATELCDFRLRLEQENGGPLQDDAEVALLFSDICDFFKFETGERALVLGRDWLVLLDRLDMEETLQCNVCTDECNVCTDELVII